MTGAEARDRVRCLAAQFHGSARTLLVTVFGDSIEPRGGTVWLGGLIALLAPFGVTERLVRTSAHRLTREGVLVTERVGRRSYYRVSPASRSDFRAAEARIYHPAPTVWDGRWTVVVGDPDQLTGPQRTDLRRHLGWLGFGPVAPGVFVHPRPDAGTVAEVLAALDLTERVLVLRARALPGPSEGSDTSIARRFRDLAATDAAYATFVERYGPLARARVLRALDGEPAFALRTLVVHDLRRVLVHDPDLPRRLLPPGWAGDDARRLAGDVYRGVTEEAEAYVGATTSTIDGPLPEPSSGYRDRFR